MIAPTLRDPSRRRHCGGFTLLEAAVSFTILALVLQASVSATIVMSRSGDFGTAELEQNARARDTLKQLAAELRTTSRETDLTGTPYARVTGSAGNETLTFRRIAAFGSNGAELVPRWSTPIVLQRRAGQLVRTQDGAETILANGVETLDFDIDSLGRIDVLVGFARASGKDGAIARQQHHFRVTPQR